MLSPVVSVAQIVRSPTDALTIKPSSMSWYNGGLTRRESQGEARASSCFFGFAL
jgi:hypothetical protein